MPYFVIAHWSANLVSLAFHLVWNITMANVLLVISNVSHISYVQFWVSTSLYSELPYLAFWLLPYPEIWSTKGAYYLYESLFFWFQYNLLLWERIVLISLENWNRTPVSWWHLQAQIYSLCLKPSLHFSWISDIIVNTSNLWSCISITNGTMNNTPTYCPFPTCIHCVLDANFGNNCNDLHLK